MNFRYGNRAFRIYARDKRSTEQISVDAIKKDLKLGSQLLAVSLNTTKMIRQRAEESVEIKKLLDKYEDVFPEELTKGVSPECVKWDFRIELKPGSSPI